jgi:replication factor C subunit 3/5
MSDFEDEMDIDVPSKDITFSSNATKGKRSAANLPVEAEDSLPWCAPASESMCAFTLSC